MALPSLSSLKHPEGNSVHPQQHHLHHHSTGNLNSNLLLASSLQANLSLVRNHDLPTSLERTGESGHLISTSSSNLEEKPVAVVHGKKNRLAYSEDDHEAINSSIKRFCLQASSSGERDLSNVHILLANGVIPNGPPATVGEDHHHQCNDDCFSDSAHCHLRHSSSVPDLRANFTVATTSPANPPAAANSAASSPSSSTCTSNPSTSFFSQILSSQINNLSSNCHASPMTHELAHSASRHTSKFQYVLGASTSMAIKMHEETMTYLNQGKLNCAAP